MTMQLFGDNETRFNTSGEIVCLVGLVACVFFAITSVHPPQPGPMLLHFVVAGSTMVGLHACQLLKHRSEKVNILQQKIQNLASLAEPKQQSRASIISNARTTLIRLRGSISDKDKLNEVGLMLQMDSTDQQLKEAIAKLEASPELKIKCQGVITQLQALLSPGQ